MSKILSVDGDDDGFYGRITTDIGEIQWSFDSDSKCCERFGTEMSQPLSWLVNRKFINVDLKEENHSRAILTLKLEDESPYDIREDLEAFISEKESGEEITTADLTKFMASFTDCEWTIEFYNNHNGYYPHNLDVTIDGTPKWNLAL